MKSLQLLKRDIEESLIKQCSLYINKSWNTVRKIKKALSELQASCAKTKKLLFVIQSDEFYDTRDELTEKLKSNRNQMRMLKKQLDYFKKEAKRYQAIEAWLKKKLESETSLK